MEKVNEINAKINDNFRNINNSINKVKSRDVNIELLRIVAMLMVVTLHCLGNGLLLDNPNINIYNSVLIRLLDTFSLTANSIFLIISGYYSINSKFNLKKILTLWGKTILYSLLIYAICRILNYITVAYDSFLPIFSGQYWFISAYIALYFLAPIINLVMNKLTKNQFKYLLITLVIMLGIIRVIFNPAGIFSGGMLPVILVYMIGGYIRKYANIKLKQKYFIKYIFLMIIVSLIYVIIYVLGNMIEDDVIYSKVRTIIIGIREYNNILIIYMTILIFMKFKTINIKSKFITKFVNLISPSMFSIYLIHQNRNIRDTMWLLMGIMNYANSMLMLPYILFMIFAVFTICLIIDLIRRGIYFTIKKISFINKAINTLNSKLDKISMKINSYIY